VGYDAPTPELNESWEQQLLEEIQKAGEKGGKGEGEIITVEDFEIRKLLIGPSEIFGTNAPLLPKQLHRIAQLSNAPFSIAFSSSNRLAAHRNAQPLVVTAASERVLSNIIEALRPKS
jgi:hypothetical protein